MNNDYAKAYTEVLEIIKYFPKEEYDRIPKEKIEFFEKNKNENYVFSIDPTIDLLNQKISPIANSIIVALYQEYFATEIQKTKINEILKYNEQKLEEEKRKKYNPDDIFKNKDIKVVKEELMKENTNSSLVEYKESFFTKFKYFIYRLLHRN